jgi:hypothetical protein
MGSSLWCPRKHGRIRSHPDAVDGGQGSWCFHHNDGRREGCARHTAGAEVGGAKGHGARGHSIEASGYGHGGGECSAGGCEPADVICQRRDDSRDWRAGNVDVDGHGSVNVNVNVNVQASRCLIEEAQVL